MTAERVDRAAGEGVENADHFVRTPALPTLGRRVECLQDAEINELAVLVFPT